MVSLVRTATTVCDLALDSDWDARLLHQLPVDSLLPEVAEKGTDPDHNEQQHDADWYAYGHGQLRLGLPQVTQV